MKKFPFSKKAINLMIATALVVTPLASLAPVGGNVSTVEASSLPAGTLQSLLDLKNYYDGLTDGQEEIIDDHRELLRGLTPGDWSKILGGLETEIDGKLTSTNTATGMMTDFAHIFLQTNYTTVVNEVISFHSKYNTDFNAAFGIDFIDYLAFYSNMINNVKANYTQSTIEAAIGSSLTNFMVAEARKVDNYSTLSASVKAAIGNQYTIGSLIEIKFKMMERLEGKTNYAPGTLKNTLIAALKQNLGTGGGGGGGVAPAPTPTPAPGAVDASDSATSQTKTNADGSKTVVSTVDVNKLTQSLQNAQSVDKVTLKVNNVAGEAAEVKLPSKAFEAVSTKNPNAKVEIQSAEGTIRVPVKEVNVANIAKSLGVNADAVEITVSIKTVNVAVKGQGSQQSKSPVVEFKITATSGDKSQGVNRFSSHVEREISAPQALNASRATVVRLKEDGSIDKAVPTVIDGSKATFKSMSNSYYTVIENTATFPDITNSWAKATIEKLASKMVINGTPAGKFEPTKNTTKAEFAALLTRALGLNNDVAYDKRFKDVKGTEWYVADMMAAVDAGILVGNSDGTFGGSEPITREQAATMIVRAITLTQAQVELNSTKSLNDFKDKAKVSPWAASSVEKLVQAGIISGRADAQVAPKASSQRAEISAMLERFLKSVNFMN